LVDKFDYIYFLKTVVEKNEVDTQVHRIKNRKYNLFRLSVTYVTYDMLD